MTNFLEVVPDPVTRGLCHHAALAKNTMELGGFTRCPLTKKEVGVLLDFPWFSLRFAVTAQHF